MNEQPTTRRLCAFIVGLFFTLCQELAASTLSNAHWAFHPPRSQPLAEVKNSRRAANPVDLFILSSLEKKNLSLTGAATREQLIRRVTFDLIGLPPTPAEIDAFVHDRSANAFERVVDRLLSSPHYGERWARHWLDVARYAESDGFEHDAVRPHSWRYRDYVIQAFNEDKPYDRFVQEQVAGDELWPGDPSAITATAFNLLGPDMVDSADQTQRRLLTLSDMTDTTAFAFLGQTLSCARCHNHKFEPLTQRDYYSLQAFFARTQFQRERAIPTELQRREHEAAMKDYRARTGATQGELDALEAPVREKLYEAKLGKLSEDAQLAHRTPKEKRTMEQEGTVQETGPQLKVSDAELTEAMSADDRARRKKLRDELKRIPKPAGIPVTMALQNSNAPAPKTFVLARGDYNHPTDEVSPDFPDVIKVAWVPSKAGLGAKPSPSPDSISEQEHSRASLAQWLTTKDNPLTARVMVNRIWKHHFGRGIVATPNDFGTRGAKPSHPELLDWLALKFQETGWSMKAMHKLMLLSATYQQSSEPTAAALERDPNNELFSRQNVRRLEGEAIRDSLLAISGRLNPAMGGPSVFPPIPEDITKTSKNWTASTSPEDHRRRSIYIFARRNLRFPFLEAFDAPDSNLSCPERGQSTTAPQSLTMLNSEEVMDAANALASRLTTGQANEEDRIQTAFRLILGRTATGKEMRMAREFLEDRAGGPAQVGQSRDSQGSSQKSKWRELCRALFNLNAFVYVD